MTMAAVAVEVAMPVIRCKCWSTGAQPAVGSFVIRLLITPLSSSSLPLCTHVQFLSQPGRREGKEVRRGGQSGKARVSLEDTAVKSGLEVHSKHLSRKRTC